MRNIVTFPTLNPSQLYQIVGSYRLGKTSNDPYYTESMGGGTQNLYVYITSHEPIKVNDWCILYDDVSNPMSVPQKYLGESAGHKLNKGLMKVIFTNDPVLIDEGVNPITEEFLEWFVVNPQSTHVKLTKKWVGFSTNNGKMEYTFNFNDDVLDTSSLIREKCEELRKQEDLETASLNYVEKSFKPSSGTPNKGIQNYYDCKHSFIAGAKWQEEVTISKIFDWLSKKDYLSDSKNSILEEFKKNN